MNTLDRVKTAYRVVDEAAPGLALGNDPSSGYSLLARAAIVQLMHLAPARARDFLKGWSAEAEQRLAGLLSPEAN